MEPELYPISGRSLQLNNTLKKLGAHFLFAGIEVYVCFGSNNEPNQNVKCIPEST